MTVPTDGCDEFHIAQINLSGGVESRHAKRSNGGISPPRLDATDSAACIPPRDAANVIEGKAQEPAMPIGSGSSDPPAQSPHLRCVDLMIELCNGSPDVRAHLLRERAVIAQAAEAAEALGQAFPY